MCILGLLCTVSGIDTQLVARWECLVSRPGIPERTVPNGANAHFFTQSDKSVEIAGTKLIECLFSLSPGFKVSECHNERCILEVC